MQYLLNQFVLKLENCGFDIADIDVYMKGVTLPRGMSSKMPHVFFKPVPGEKKVLALRHSLPMS